MISLQELRDILKEKGLLVPEESLETLRDFVDMQAEMILDSWIEDKKRHKDVK